MAKLELKDTNEIEKPDQTAMEEKSEDSLEKQKEHGSNMFSKLSETFTFKVNKPLIPLKMAVFCWFGASAVVTPFASLYLKQKGLSLKQLSLIYTFLPIVQFLGPAISGAIADKIGRAKPVLQANIVLAIIATTAMLFIPKFKQCNQELIHCDSVVTNSDSIIKHCHIQSNGSEIYNCTFQCASEPQNEIPHFCFKNYISSCDLLPKHDILGDFAWRTNTSENEKHCVKEPHPESDNGTSNEFWCLNHRVANCNSTCEQSLNSTQPDTTCQESGGEQQLFIVSFVLMTAFLTFFSNCFRILDVTAMSMIKTYKSDFGRQRFWSISGTLVFSPLAGYVITLASPENGEQRYDIIFYFFDVMAVLSMIVVWKLDVKTEPPSKNLFKSSLALLKNLDVMIFFTALFVIGTAWGFTKLFANWYLEGLGAPSSLMGLIPSVNSLIGLPFLLKSKWFVAKFGSDNLLIAAFVGYTCYCTGYSFLQNPWWSLVFEIFGIVNYHLLWVTVVTHSHEVAPIGFAATAVSIAGGIHYGIGKGSGTIIGGFIMDKYGGRLAFRVMASLCAVAGVMYALYSYIRRRCTNKEMDLKRIETQSMKFYYVENFTLSLQIDAQYSYASTSTEEVPYHHEDLQVPGTGSDENNVEKHISLK